MITFGKNKPHIKIYVLVKIQVVQESSCSLLHQLPLKIDVAASMISLHGCVHNEKNNHGTVHHTSGPGIDSTRKKYERVVHLFVLMTSSGKLPLLHFHFNAFTFWGGKKCYLSRDGIPSGTIKIRKYNHIYNAADARVNQQRMLWRKH